VELALFASTAYVPVMCENEHSKGLFRLFHAAARESGLAEPTVLEAALEEPRGSSGGAGRATVDAMLSATILPVAHTFGALSNDPTAHGMVESSSRSSQAGLEEAP